MSSIWKDLLNLIFPARPECPFCGRPGPGGEVCAPCGAVLEAYRREASCGRCGRLPGKGAVFLKRGSTRLCLECRSRDWPFALARAAGPYEGLLKEAIHRFKYAGRRSLAGRLAGLMAAVCLEEPRYSGLDLVLPVPLSAEKLLHRGFNQAGLLSRELGALLGMPVADRCLVKVVDTPPQAGLSKIDRKTNLEDAFKVTNTGRVYGKNILLVDDVFTTGSTFTAAASVIRQAGARQVLGLTVATGRCL